MFFLVAEALQKMQAPPALPVYPIFTSSPLSSRFKRPVFKEKNLNQPTNKYSECKVQQQILVTQEETEAHVLKRGDTITLSENRVEPHNQMLQPSTPTTTPSCRSESPVADDPDEGQEEEDQSIFFTPELFEGEGDEGSPLKETDSVARLVLGPDASALLSEERFCFEQNHSQEEILVSTVSTKLGQADEVVERKQGEETVLVGNLKRKTGSRSCRLSRSWQKIPSTPTGN